MIDTDTLLPKLGFNIHPDKPKFISSQIATFIGFVINSVEMKVYLATERKEKIKEACLQLLRQYNHTIRFVARVIGLMTASFPAVKYGPLPFRDLEHCKSEGVNLSKGNYDATIQLTSEAKQEVQWWICQSTTELAYNNIYHDNPSLSLTTDASKVGWGATLASVRT